MQTRTLTVALVGNPNTGKTTLFNALTGLRQHVGNYPGVTVELKIGTARLDEKLIHVIDLPGTYSLAARSPDEMVAVDLLLGQRPEEPPPDVVLSIVDASNLERHLYLTSQLLDLGVPVVVAVNLIDVAETHGLKIDFERLSKQLGLPVVPVQANRSKGLAELKRTLVKAAEEHIAPVGPTFPEAFEAEVAALRESIPAETPTLLVRRLLLDVGGFTEDRFAQRFGDDVHGRVRAARERLSAAGCPVPAVEARARFAWVRSKVAGCVVRPQHRVVTWSERLDKVLTHRVWGTLVFLALMFAVFQAIFAWALPLMGLIDEVKEWIASGVESSMDPGPLRSLLSDGVIKGVGSVLVFVPQICILFAFIAVLEDCGYMARAAFLMDRIMCKVGLNGKSFIPLLSSVACAIPGIMATRTIENRRDRFATILVAPLMSCSARLPLYMLLIGTFLSDPWWLPGVALFGMYLIGLIVAPLVALTLKRTLLKGATPVFVMEMPAFKWPQLKTVLRRVIDAGWAFIRRAGTLILASMVLIWALLYFPHTMPDGRSYDEVIEKAESAIESQMEVREAFGAAASGAATIQLQENIDEATDNVNMLHGNWKRNSLLGKAGQVLEPVFKPLGWDWKLGMAALASFPAREVVVGTLGIIYNQGDVDPKEIGVGNAAESPLGQAVQREWSQDPLMSKYRIPVALSLMVFFALCCQCVSTLAVIRRETKSWSWPLFTFAYMTILAYVGALLTFQVGRMIVG